MKANPNRADLYLTPTRRKRLESIAAEMEANGISAHKDDGSLKLSDIIDYLLEQHEPR